MKVAVWHNLPSGGGKRALFNHVRALKENGYDVEAWTTDMASESYLPLSNLITENRKKLKDSYYALWKINNPIKREHAIAQLLNDHCLECIREIEQKDFDLLFANSCSVSNIPYIGKFSKIPSVVYLGEPYRALHEALPDNIWKAPYEKLKLKKIKRIINDHKLNYSNRLKLLHEIDAAKSYDKILVNSLFSRETIIRSYGIDANVCYLGIDTDEFKPSDSNKEPYVVGVGTICFIKSVKEAIKIIAKIPTGVRPVLKWIANGVENPYLNECIKLAQDLKVEFNYFINIPDADMKEIVSRAAIMIYIPKLEPFGLAPLEANACGTYVIGIAEGGVRESITNGINGTVVNGYRVTEIADVIKTFVTDLNLAKIKGLEASTFVHKKWNIDFLSKNIINELNDAVKTF